MTYQEVIWNVVLGAMCASVVLSVVLFVVIVWKAFRGKG